VYGRTGCNLVSAHLSRAAVERDDRAWMLGGPTYVPRVPEWDRDFLVL
jgi:hypothetical protein